MLALPRKARMESLIKIKKLSYRLVYKHLKRHNFPRSRNRQAEKIKLARFQKRQHLIILKPLSNKDLNGSFRHTMS
jgi:hypothetical protein